MNNSEKKMERGQSLVIIALGIIAFVAMLALVLDGANAYAARRQAQNAADAGALAGANYMCKNLSDPNVIINTKSTANQYAVLNGAVDPAEVIPNLSAATVTVNAMVTKDTYFAKIIGFDKVNPKATAEAACRNPGAGVLPVAWSCRAPAGGEITSLDCEMKVNQDYVKDPGNYELDPNNLDYTYVAMDSVKVNKKNNDPICKTDNPPDECYESLGDVECAAPVLPACDAEPPEGKIDCDIDNDCIDELMTGGARAWLDLDGSGGGAADLKDWIAHPETVPDINVHDWLPSAQGTDTSIFRVASQNIVGEDVILPVFNNLCKTGEPDIWSDQIDPETTENCTYTDLDNLDLAGSNVNYHIYSFSAFHVTCIQLGKNKNSVYAENGYVFFNDYNNKDWCNGHALAVENGSIDEGEKTIEGYFTKLDLGGYAGNGTWNNTGTFTVVLTK
jgi:hypothetical protein